MEHGSNRLDADEKDAMSMLRGRDVAFTLASADDVEVFANGGH